MKSFTVFGLLVVLAVSVYGDDLGDGRPDCATDNEITVGLYRNLWDPTAYWKCEKLNESAVAVRCADQTAFLDSKKQCVPWEDWQWEEPIAQAKKD